MSDSPDPIPIGPRCERVESDRTVGHSGFVGTVHVVPPPRRVLSLIAAVAVALGLCVACTTKATGHGQGPAADAQPSATTSSPSAGTGATTPAPKPSTIDFSDCSGLFNLSAAGIPADRRSKLTFDCGRQNVPVDYAQPNGPTISIEVIRVHYRDQPARIGSLLVNPGGPGGSGVFLAISLAASLSDDVLQHFDIVGFDPRGVGLSSPIKCETDPAETQALALDPDVRTASGLEQAKRQAQTFAASCDRKYGAALAHYNTVETARDMDQIRAAVGDEQMNYLGFSYGTELGAVYAHLFPTKIRVAVLDGAVDPLTTGNAIASNEQQIGGFESAFDQFAADCAKRPECKPLGNARKAVAALEKKANTTPIPSSDGGETRKATGGNVLYAVLSALYSEQLWPDLGTGTHRRSARRRQGRARTRRPIQRARPGRPLLEPARPVPGRELQRPEQRPVRCRHQSRGDSMGDEVPFVRRVVGRIDVPVPGLAEGAAPDPARDRDRVEAHPRGRQPARPGNALRRRGAPGRQARHRGAADVGRAGAHVLRAERLHRPEGQCIPDQRDRADREHHLPALNGARREPAAA